MKICLVVSFICLLGLDSFGQTGENSCKMTLNEEVSEIIDSVQFRAVYCSNIDLSNSDCSFTIGEVYSNVVPECLGVISVKCKCPVSAFQRDLQ